MKTSICLKTCLLILIGLLMVSATENRSYSDGIISPSAMVKKIVFYSDRNGNDDIFMMNQDGSGLVQLTDDPGDDDSPIISPDGKSIIFASDREGDWNIYKMTAEGEITGPPAERITLCPPFCDSDEKQPDWSPDGTEIVFISDIGGSKDIYTMKLTGTNLIRITISPYDEQGPQWSPTGGEIVYVSDRYGNRDIWIIEKKPDKGGKERRLTCDTGDDASPAWHPDGDKIVYTAFYQGKSHIVKIKNTNCSCDVDPDFPEECVKQTLTRGNFFDRSPSFSPNGRKIAFSSNRFDNFDIWRMKANGKGMEPLTINPGYDSAPDWGEVSVSE